MVAESVHLFVLEKYSAQAASSEYFRRFDRTQKIKEWHDSVIIPSDF